MRSVAVRAAETQFSRVPQSERGTGRRSGVQSVGVGAALLWALADAAGPEPWAEMAAQLREKPGDFAEATYAVQGTGAPVWLR
jgi:hypothetical protein